MRECTTPAALGLPPDASDMPNSVRNDAETRQPTIRRVKTSITNATYTKPRHVPT